MTKGELKRQQKWAEYNQNILRQLTECGLEVKLIDAKDEKYLSKIIQWRTILQLYCQRYGAQLSEVKQLGNDVLRSWMYAGVFGESRYAQGLLDFMKDCSEYDTLYLINGITLDNARIKIEIKNALKFCQNVIHNKISYKGDKGEYRLKINELSGCFLLNAKKNKVLYYEVDMGTQTWYFGK